MNRQETCCFTGYHRLPPEKVGQFVRNLDREIEHLIGQGVNTFISGGAIGFEMIAAWLIVAKKEMRKDIRLVLALPYRDHDAQLNEEQRQLFHALLAEADEVVYASGKYSDACMKKRDCYMVDRSGYCVCARLYPFNGTDQDQTVRYARRKGVRVVNVAV